MADLLHYELRDRIDPNFRFSFVQLDPASDLDPFSFDTGKHGRFVYRRCRRYPPGKGLVGIGRSDVQKRVPAFAGECLGDHSFNRYMFAGVRSCFVGCDDYPSRGVGTGLK